MVKLNTYFDFAEDSFQMFKKIYENNIRGNELGALAQNICERYMKHLLDTFCTPKDADESNELNYALHTHNLSRIIDTLDSFGITYSERAENAILSINGFYFTRYPGDDVVEMKEKRYQQCYEADNICRDETIEKIKDLS